MSRRKFLCAAGLAGAFVHGLSAQQFIINDRINDRQWLAADSDGNGVIDETTEIAPWFDATNTAGTLGPQNPTSLAIRSDGLTIFGDQLRRAIFLLRDRNYDGDALDVGESAIVADATNLSGVSFAFPTGAAFDSIGRPYIVNAGNSFGNDGVYRLVDSNDDGDFQDIAEVRTYVGAPFFGPGNGSFSPQEIAFDADDVMYLRNSSSGLHGVYRFADGNGNGRADDAGEASVFINNANASGIPISAGFGLALDPLREDALYFLEIQSGGVDFLIRARDLNGDNDAQDFGEAEIVFEALLPPFSAIDVLALQDGRLILTDTGIDQLVELEDVNGDGDFHDVDESRILFANANFELAGTRQVNVLPDRNPADLNCDGAISVADIGPFVLALTNEAGYFSTFPNCNRSNADLNADGNVTVSDIGLFVSALTG